MFEIQIYFAQWRWMPVVCTLLETVFFCCFLHRLMNFSLSSILSLSLTFSLNLHPAIPSSCIPLFLSPFIPSFSLFLYVPSFLQNGVMTTVTTTASVRSGIARQRTVTWWAAPVWEMARENLNVNPVSNVQYTHKRNITKHLHVKLVILWSRIILFKFIVSQNNWHFSYVVSSSK